MLKQRWILLCLVPIEAHGARVYIVVCKGQARLLCSKSRIAPLKTLTVPTLNKHCAKLLSRLIAARTNSRKVLLLVRLRGCTFMHPRQAIQIQHFCSETNCVSGLALPSNILKSSRHSVPRCFTH